MEINAIQKIINEKAEKRLNKDLDEILKFIEGNRLLRDLEVTSSHEKPLKDTLHRHFLWGHDNRLIILIKNKYLPIYIEEETKAFVKSVDELRTRVDELYDASGAY